MDHANIERKRRLRINTTVCDMTEVSEASLAAYDSVHVNAALVLVSAQTRELVSKYGVTINSATVVEVPAGTAAAVKNGNFIIKPGEAPSKQTFLIVNGKLHVEPKTEDVITAYVGIVVNGTIMAPESMTGLLSGVTINGAMETYPDDAIMMGGVLKLNRVFILRAKPALYCAHILEIMDTDIDIDALKSSGASFSGKVAFIAESLVGPLAALIDDKTHFEVLPDGCAIIRDDVHIDGRSAARYGSKLFIDGGLTLDDDAEAFLAKLEFLKVRGAVALSEKLLGPFEKLGAQYDELVIRKNTGGYRITDKPSVVIDDRMIKKHGFISVSDCAKVKISQSLSLDTIEDCLAIEDCALVTCFPEQEAAVCSICNDVAKISTGGDLEDMKNLMSETGPFGGFGFFDKDTQTINAANYKM